MWKHDFQPNSTKPKTFSNWLVTTVVSSAAARGGFPLCFLFFETGNKVENTSGQSSLLSKAAESQRAARRPQAPPPSFLHLHFLTPESLTAESLTRVAMVTESAATLEHLRPRSKLHHAASSRLSARWRRHASLRAASRAHFHCRSSGPIRKQPGVSQLLGCRGSGGGLSKTTIANDSLVAFQRRHLLELCTPEAPDRGMQTRITVVVERTS